MGHNGIEKSNTWLQRMVVYFDLFKSCLPSTSYIHVLVETVLRPGIIMATETGGEEENAGINNLPLAAAASNSVVVAMSKLLTESHQPLVSSTD